MPKVSIVIPVYNEEDNVAALVDQVGQAMLPTNWPFELVLVDDGSRDKSAIKMAELAQSNAWLKCVYLIRNYGQSTALQAGFDEAQGDYIVTLDGDLQNDPADIPKLITMLDQDPTIDCVSGWRKSRQDAALSRKIPSQIANALISKVTKVQLHDYGCALKAYRASIIKSLRLYGELHRFIPALASEVGARIVEVPVNHRARVAGVSKYGIDRTIRVLLDLLWIRFTMRFLHRPIHAFGGVAVLMLIVGMGILGWLGFEKIVLGTDIGGRPLLLLGVLLTLVGVQLLATGLIGELLVRIYHEPQGRRQYLTKKVSAPANRDGTS
ncbi:MAG: dolichol-phosphate mannosyltransferase [Pseudomonadota bacterium]